MSDKSSTKHPVEAFYTTDPVKIERLQNSYNEGLFFAKSLSAEQRQKAEVDFMNPTPEHIANLRKQFGLS